MSKRIFNWKSAFIKIVHEGCSCIEIKTETETLERANYKLNVDMLDEILIF